MHILVTRPEETMHALKARLQAAGHDVMCAPLLEISPIYSNIDYEGVAALAFTSANGVRFVPHLEKALASNLAVYAVGPRTAITAKDVGFDIVMQATGDVDALKKMILQSQPAREGRIIHFCGTVTIGNLVEDLQAQGYDAERVEVYDAHGVDDLPAQAVAGLQAGNIDAVLFYSARTVTIFETLAEKAGLSTALSGVRCLCLSQAVADRASMLGWHSMHVALEPNEPSMLKLVDGVAKGVKQA